MKKDTVITDSGNVYDWGSDNFSSHRLTLFFYMD